MVGDHVNGIIFSTLIPRAKGETTSQPASTRFCLIKTVLPVKHIGIKYLQKTEFARRISKVKLLMNFLLPHCLNPKESIDFNGITGPAEEQLSRVVKDIQSYRDLENVTIYGYTDRLGSNGYNSVLSQKRAETIKAYLIQHGIPADKISAIGKGPADPKVSCNEVKGAELKDCLRPNRRVEILIKGTR